ncbi:hypothetical protein [Lactococcus lactis]|uniref:hypothetical protein n=1 Tax=Lactococcus lactis TaxID=1358 RepID=UPI00197FFDF7|nr:hypothetical protein [Lactococcus lactis]MDO6179152.1 hypothetical protein [Lactococcus lactis]UTG79561.1 hypothetical protein MK801_01415 [Lactococcus lactis]
MAKNRINELRKAQNLTLKGLVELLKEKNIKVNASQISSYEKGTTPRNEDIWKAFSEIFGVSIGYVMGISDIPDVFREDERVISAPQEGTEEYYMLPEKYRNGIPYSPSREIEKIQEFTSIQLKKNKDSLLTYLAQSFVDSGRYLTDQNLNAIITLATFFSEQNMNIVESDYTNEDILDKKVDAFWDKIKNNDDYTYTNFVIESGQHLY